MVGTICKAIRICTNELPSFIEIPGLGRVKGGPYDKVVNLLQEYQTERSLEKDSAIDGPMREKEVESFTVLNSLHIATSRESSQ